MQISECVSLLKDVEQNAMSTRDAAKMLYDFFDEIYKIKFFRKIWYQLFSWDQYDLQEHYMRKLAKIGSIARKKSKKFLAKQKEVRKRKIILLDHVSVIAQGQYNDLDKLLSETTIKITKEMVNITRSAPDGFTGANWKQGAVYLNIERTSELDAEGYAREIMRKVKDLRKKTE